MNWIGMEGLNLHMWLGKTRPCLVISLLRWSTVLTHFWRLQPCLCLGYWTNVSYEKRHGLEFQYSTRALGLIWQNDICSMGIWLIDPHNPRHHRHMHGRNVYTAPTCYFTVYCTSALHVWHQDRTPFVRSWTNWVQLHENKNIDNKKMFLINVVLWGDSLSSNLSRPM